MSSTKIMWADGIAKAPDDSAMREVPAKYPWTASLWCSQDGLVWRRHWSAIAGTWLWSDDGPVDYVEDASGRMGVYLHRGWTPLEVVIAMAWRHRTPSERATHDPRSPVDVDEGKPIHADNIRWVEAEANAERGVIAHEKWKPLKGRIGAVPIPDGYMISTAGRLKNVATAQVTQGYWFDGACGPTRLAAVKGCGLCDLWLEAKLIEPAVCPAPRIRTAAECLVNGDTPADLADRMSIGIETAWSYCKDAVKQLALPRSKMRELGEGLIARDLWRLLVKMWEEDDDRLDARLNDLFEAVEEELTEDGAYARRGWSKGELAFARQMIVSQA